jgi:stage II sporulation protein D
MIKIKPFVVLGAVLIALTLIIPAILVIPFSDQHRASGKLGEELTKTPVKQANVVPASSDPAVEVAVFRTARSTIESVQLEDYLVGVVAAEMPVDFKEEALKAQALTARTYIVNRLINKDTLDSVPKGAQVTDTQVHQVYMNDAEQRQDWGVNYEWKKKKILDAVRSTAGQILTYDGKPIDALFFSTGNGYTENSEDVWKGKFPYLRSVSSPWDKKSPKYNSQKVMSVHEFETRLGVNIGSGSTIGKIVDRTEGKRVAKVDFKEEALTAQALTARSYIVN